MPTGKVSVARVAVDWDGDFFICYDARPTDALNIMNSGLNSNAALVNLHWYSVNKSGINSATVSYTTSHTDYGLRLLHCVTGTNTTAGAYFGRTGSTNDFVVTNATTYTAVFWIKATSGSGVSFNIAMENSSGSGSFTISSSWQKVTRTFTTSGTTTAFKITKATDATNVTFDVTGFMIVAGSTAPGGFNLGYTTNLYDTLDGVVKSVAIKMGLHDWTKRWMDEGTADIKIDNDTRTYSPEYSSSPLFGAIGPRRRITVDIQAYGDTTWTRLFSGFTEEILPNPRKNGTREAKIKAVQGRFQLDKVPFNTFLSGDVTIDTVIAQVLQKGFVSAATPIQGVASLSKANMSYCSDLSAIYSLETGVSTIPINQEAWGGDSPASKVLEELLEVEQGFFFIDRSGKAYFYNRHHYIDPAVAPSPITVSLDSKSQDSAYEFNKPYTNNILVTYHPPSTRTDTVWESRVNYFLRAGHSKKIRAKFQYTEGKKVTVTAVNPFDGTADASTAVITSGPASASSKLVAEVTLGNGQAAIRLKNGATHNIRVYVTLKGTVQESTGGFTIERTTDSGVIGGAETLKKNIRQIDNEDDANNYGAYLLDLFRGTIGQFPSFKMKSTDSTRLAEMLAIKQGVKLSVSEYQTGHSGSYAVIGEDHSWSAEGVLESTYSLFPLHRLRAPWILGTTALGSSTYLAY